MPLRRQLASGQRSGWHLLLQEDLLIPHALDSYEGFISSPDLCSLLCAEWNTLFELES